MSKKLNIISIGYAGRLLDSQSREYTRMLSYAAKLESYTMVVFTLRSEGLPDYLEAGNLKIIGTHSNSKIGALFAAARIIKKLVKQNRRTTYILTAQDPFETSFVANRVTAKNVLQHVQVHGDFYGNQWWQRQSVLNRLRAWYGLRVLKQRKHIRVVSSRIKASLVALGIREYRVNVLPIRAEIEAITLRPTAPVSGAPIFIWVGRMAPEKNLPGLLEAFARVHAAVPAATLRLIGDGPLRENVEHMCQSLQVTDAVQLEGWRDDLPQVLGAADVFVLASHYEGHAMVLHEAMAAGLPLVTTDVGCVGDLVEANVHGLVVPPSDNNALAEAMHAMITNPETYAALASNVQAQAALLRSQTAESYVAAWVAELERVIPEV